MWFVLLLLLLLHCWIVHPDFVLLFRCCCSVFTFHCSDVVENLINGEVLWLSLLLNFYGFVNDFRSPCLIFGGHVNIVWQSNNSIHKHTHSLNSAGIYNHKFNGHYMLNGLDRFHVVLGYYYRRVCIVSSSSICFSNFSVFSHLFFGFLHLLLYIHYPLYAYMMGYRVKAIRKEHRLSLTTVRMVHCKYSPRGNHLFQPSIYQKWQKHEDWVRVREREKCTHQQTHS